MLWLNNKPIDEKQALSSHAVSGLVRGGAVTVQVPQTGRRIDLKVGQSVELTLRRCEGARGARERHPPRKPAETEQPPTQAPSADAVPGKKAAGEVPAARGEAQPGVTR